MLPLCLKEAEVAEKLLTVRDMAVLDDKRNAQDEPLDDEEDSSSDEEEAASIRKPIMYHLGHKYPPGASNCIEYVHICTFSHIMVVIAHRCSQTVYVQRPIM